MILLREGYELCQGMIYYGVRSFGERDDDEWVGAKEVSMEKGKRGKWGRGEVRNIARVYCLDSSLS